MLFLDKSVDNEKCGSQHPPHGDVSGQRLGDGGPAELDADQELGHDDGDQHPGLSPQFVTLGVVKELESFSQTYYQLVVKFCDKKVLDPEIPKNLGQYLL